MGTGESGSGRWQNQIADELAALAERLCRSTVQVRGRRAGAGSGVIGSANGAKPGDPLQLNFIRGGEFKVCEAILQRPDPEVRAA